MPTAFDLIGHNQALQEHWMRRVLAIVIDAIVVSVVYLAITLPINMFRLDAIAFPFLWGLILWIYSTLLETMIGGTFGKKLAALHVVALDGAMDFPRALIRNISKIHWVFLLLDSLLGAATPGDPRQRFLDRVARTTVTRVDQQAYIEEQFRMMQHVPPRPMAPPPGAYPPPAAPPPSTPVPPPQAPPPGGWPQQPAATWPGQTPPATTWPQHAWDEQGQLKPEMRFCTACGGQLVSRGDGKLTCVRCGTVY